MLIEPIQGEGGAIVPKVGYLEEICRIARKHDVLVICDEVQTGFFRTGKFLAFQHSECYPDIMVLSKGLGGIGFPIAAIIYRREIESWSSGDHIGTFRGNQVGIAAGSSALDFIAQHNLPDHIQEMSDYLYQKLLDLEDCSPYIGEVRRKGLFVGVEYVQDKQTRDPYPKIVKEIQAKCLQKGLLFETGGHYGNVVTFHSSVNY